MQVGLEIPFAFLSFEKVKNSISKLVSRDTQRRTFDATRPDGVMWKYQPHCITHVHGAPAVHATALNTRQRPTMFEVTIQQPCAGRSNQAHVGGLVACTVVPVHVMMLHVSFVEVLRHQLSLHVDRMFPYKAEKWMDCEPHLAARLLSRNAQERPCHSQEGHTGGTTPPALQPQEHCVHNTSVAHKAPSRAQPPSSLI